VVSTAPLAGSPGQYEVNVQLPADLPGGSVPVSVWAGDYSSPAGAVLTVARPAPVESPTEERLRRS
jgi:uncharacterized protein (TIGR03437 family)